MEHEHHHLEEEPHTHHRKNEFSVPGSILVGAILISASIFYNTKLIIKEFGIEAAGSRITVAANQAAPGAPAAVNPQAEGPVNVASRNDAPVLGKNSAKVMVMEFSDFQCPFCQRFFTDAYKQIKAKYIDTGKAKFVFRHFPLPGHQNAQKAAEAAECANRQGKFEKYHDTLFTKGQADGTGLDVPSLKTYAKELGLDTGKFNACLDTGETAEIVKKDLSDGAAAGVSGTPTVFVNGKKIVGAQPFAVFEAAIEAELKK